MYSLEVNAKPAITDKNRFIIDVGRTLDQSLLPTELSYEIGFFIFMSVSILYLKDFEEPSMALSVLRPVYGYED